MMLGFLLARAGVDVLVLEKHGDFLRDFRGDTIHPSTLEVMSELGLLDKFLSRPHQELRQVVAKVGGKSLIVADFSHLPTRCRFMALMPQWDFLNFLVEEARPYPEFHLKMQAEVTDLIEENGAIAGLRAETGDGPLEVRAALTVGADGRHSAVRRRAGLEVINSGAPMDVMWMRLSRYPGDPGQTFGHFEQGKILVMINREDYWQCAYVIPKGTADEIRQRGMPSFHKEIVKLEPFLRSRVNELSDWNQVNVLTVAVDRLSHWARPGLLCIGDAAHAMSPIGGVGINLAIQDAVAAANILGPKLVKGTLLPQDFRRCGAGCLPTEATQRLQVAAQNRVISRILTSGRPLALPWEMRLLKWLPALRRLTARVLGLGFRPEHVKLSAKPGTRLEQTRAA